MHLYPTVMREVRFGSNVLFSILMTTPTSELRTNNIIYRKSDHDHHLSEMSGFTSSRTASALSGPCFISLHIRQLGS